ncbi:MAG: phosphatase PAP2-related protein [Candidatus Paceibacterota bacterium]|jgi:hypothetical protein
MEIIVGRAWKQILNNRGYVGSLILSLCLLLASLVINYYSGIYATAEVSNSVTDIILSNIPVFDVDGAFVYGGILMAAAIILLCLRYPRRMPFVIKTISIFYVVRSISVSLTHIAPFPGRVAVEVVGLMRFFNFDGQLFFSGHTGLPFLIALIFWHNKRLRYLFLAFSLSFAVVVLLGHLHYSIDVFAAFFITYGIFRLSEVFFREDSLRV